MCYHFYSFLFFVYLTIWAFSLPVTVTGGPYFAALLTNSVPVRTFILHELSHNMSYKNHKLPLRSVKRAWVAKGQIGPIFFFFGILNLSKVLKHDPAYF